MVKRGTAALLLFVVAAWAELLLAPMFSIRAAHAHIAHAMAQPRATHDDAMPLPHSCCPSLQRAAVTVPIVEFTAASLPCADEHRCCFRQGSQGAPATTRQERKPSRDIHVLLVAALKPASHAIPSRLPDSLAPSPPSLFTVILRI